MALVASRGPNLLSAVWLSYRRPDRLILGGALGGLIISLGLHARALAGVTPEAWGSWSWLLHVGAVLGGWYVVGRIAAGGLRGVSGLLRMRRMVPIPLRLALAAAAFNAAIAAGLTVVGHAGPDRAWSAYWCMMYLLVTIAAAFVLPRIDTAAAGTPG